MAAEDFNNTIIQRIEILDDEGNVLNTVNSSEYWAEYIFPGRWRVAVPPGDAPPGTIPVIPPEPPAPAIPEPEVDDAESSAEDGAPDEPVEPVEE
jgi:hypothetical protein